MGFNLGFKGLTFLRFSLSAKNSIVQYSLCNKDHEPKTGAFSDCLKNTTVISVPVLIHYLFSCYWTAKTTTTEAAYHWLDGKIFSDWFVGKDLEGGSSGLCKSTFLVLIRGRCGELQYLGNYCCIFELNHSPIQFWKLNIKQWLQ